MIIQSIRDFFWVLWAFIRGKVLRQQDYIPSPDVQAFCMSLMKPSWSINNFNVGRFAILLRWWGPMEMTRRQIFNLERLAVEAHPAFGFVPFRFWYNNTLETFLGVSGRAWFRLREDEMEANS